MSRPVEGSACTAAARSATRDNGIVDDGLREAMRAFGIGAFDDNGAASLTRNGSISLVRRRR